MFILRVEYKTGQRYDFGFRDRAQGTAARDAIMAAPVGADVHVMDDHGHSAILFADGLLCLMLVDAQAEALGQQEVRYLLSLVQRPAAADAGVVRMPAAGRRVNFEG